MKKKIYNFAIFLAAFLACAMYSENALCQWEEEVRLTYDPYSSWLNYMNGARAVVSHGDTLHVVWQDQRDGNWEIYYKRSVDEGGTWEEDIRLTNEASWSHGVCIALSGQVVHIVWCDERDGNWEIYYKRSMDGGVTWESDLRLTIAPERSDKPVIAVSGSIVHIIWYDNRDGSGEIYYKRSIDDGISWDNDIRLTNDPEWSSTPSIAVSGSVVHIAWRDDRDGNPEIYYKQSTDNGISWGPDIRLTHDPQFSLRPCISVSGSVVYVTWNDSRDGNGEIYYKRSTDGGVSWENDVRLTYAPEHSDYPNIAASGSAVHIVWEDSRDNARNIYYIASMDQGVTWEEETQLTNHDGFEARQSFITVSGTAVHVVWEDSRDPGSDVYYKRNLTGNLTKIDNEGLQISKNVFLSQNRPNPFSQFTVYDLQFSKGENVRLAIYDLNGREVAVLVDGYVAAGSHEVKFDAGDLPGGVYLCRLQTGNLTEIKKLIILK